MTITPDALRRLREEALDCEHRGEPISTHAGDVLQLIDAFAAATKVNDRIVTILDEAAGMQPVMSAEEALTQLEAHLHSMRADLAAATARAEAADKLLERFVEALQLRGAESLLDVEKAARRHLAEQGRLGPAKEKP